MQEHLLTRAGEAAGGVGAVGKTREDGAGHRKRPAGDAFESLAVVAEIVDDDRDAGRRDLGAEGRHVLDQSRRRGRHVALTLHDDLVERAEISLRGCNQRVGIGALTERFTNERIAIVGIGLRYPDADSTEDLWENILAGRRAFRRLPDERLAANAEDVFERSARSVFERSAVALAGGGACVGLAQSIESSLASQGFNANCDPATYANCVPFGDMDANYSNGSSVYHGLTANLKKRFGNHYEFLGSYTWSHAIDDSTDLQSTLTPQDSYYPGVDRST